jgi:hypothetical protein
MSGNENYNSETLKKTKNVDNKKITREELRRFEKWSNASDEALDSLRDFIYQFALITLKSKSYE